MRSGVASLVATLCSLIGSHAAQDVAACPMAYALFVDASGSGYGGAHLTFCYRGTLGMLSSRGWQIVA